MSATDLNNLGNTAGFNASGSLGGGITSYRAINNLDQSVGTSRLADQSSHGVIWSGDTLHDLGGLNGLNTDAIGINDAGLVVGRGYLAGPPLQIVPVYWDSNGIHVLPRLSESVLTQNVTEATDVNNSGLMVGYSSYMGLGLNQAVSWSDGIMQPLGFIGAGTNSIGRAVNDLGQIVGLGAIAGPFVNHGFLWESGMMSDLNDLISPEAGYTITDAWDINEQGQIVATAVRSDSLTRSVRLDPISVPEPGAWALLILGFAGAGAALRRRRLAFST